MVMFEIKANTVEKAPIAEKS